MPNDINNGKTGLQTGERLTQTDAQAGDRPGAAMACGITPNNIKELKANEVFVFGSNLQGMHLGGAARAAKLKFGAIMGQGVGLQGQSYAIPTMHGGVDMIKPYTDEFIAFAKEHPDLHFLVTRIGCGIASFRDTDIAPLFAEATTLANVSLPKEFINAIRDNTAY